jgi:hypothetical protein
MDSEDEEFKADATDAPENDDMETEDAILERQLELTTPAKAKAAATKII